jgi:large conductance mechanosensitive channel protein
MTNEDAMLEELKEIRKLLAAKPPTPPPPVGFLNEFRDFLSKYKVMGLAVAFILAIYLGQVVQALVNDLVMPIVNLTLPKDVAWDTWKVGPFLPGHFGGTVLTFIIVALVIFLIVKLTKRFKIE